MRLRLMIASVLLIALVGFAMAQHTEQDMPAVVHASKLKFASIPGIPDCATGAPLRGDPSKGAFVLEVHSNAGCTIPTHWHSTNEEVAMISGSASVTMGKQSPQAMGSGAYVFLPAKAHHSFTCNVTCSFFLMVDGAFDIHYVDKSGKEISPDEALKAVGEKQAPMKTKK